MSSEDAACGGKAEKSALCLTNGKELSRFHKRVKTRTAYQDRRGHGRSMNGRGGALAA